MNKQLNPFLLRRVDPKVLDAEFEDCLDTATNMYNRGKDKSSVSLPQFRNRVISMLIDSIHYDIHSSVPEELQWYDDVFYMLKDYYGGKIKKRLDQLNSKTINESKLQIYMLRRIDVVEHYLNNLSSKDICIHWSDDEALEYSSQILSDMSRIIIDELHYVDSESYVDKYDEIYQFLIDLDYPKRIVDFFYDSLKTCEDKHRYKFRKP